MKRYITALLCLLMGLQGLEAQTLKVMSYNIHIGQNAAGENQLKNIADFIKRSKADLVGIQEVDSVCNRSGNIDQMKFLAEQTGMHYAYVRHFAFDGGSYGLGILSRYPLSDIKNNRISLTSEGKKDTRALVSATVFSGKKQLTFATVHLDYRDANSRVIQSTELVKLFGGGILPVILTGDFNAIPGTKEIINLENIFKDITPQSALTYPAVKPLKKIDYIMVDKRHLAKIVKQVVLSVEYSDHLPVMSVVKIQKD